MALLRPLAIGSGYEKLLVREYSPWTTSSGKTSKDMRFQPGDVVTFKTDPTERWARERHGVVRSQIHISRWFYVGVIDKFIIVVNDDFGLQETHEVWGENLELLVLDTLANIQ
jgi:hypothetical protein